jgi:hypothetical protein
MEVGKCKWIAQSQAMLDLLFLSAANIFLLTADANVSEMVPMPMPMRWCQCQWSNCKLDCQRCSGAMKEHWW